jgi:hypothetical protein
MNDYSRKISLFHDLQVKINILKKIMIQKNVPLCYDVKIYVTNIFKNNI